MAAIETDAADWSRVKVRWTTDLIRFLFSRHCRDLLFIAVGAAALTALAALGVHSQYGWQTWIADEAHATVTAAVLAGLFAVWAWAFQSSNLRFGAADIFASEIATLCRICAVVDFIPHLVDGYRGKGAHMRPGQSKQDYVVIFHNNSKDLEILDGVVVTWVTEFYVYFKAMQDTMSRLPESDRDSAYKEALLNVIYMAFLTFESGRQALMRLIDDGRVRREAMLTALLNEIPAYKLLREAFKKRKNDLRAQRIEARYKSYEQLMDRIHRLSNAEADRGGEGNKIRHLAGEVLARWNKEDGPPVKPSPEPKAPIAAPAAGRDRGADAAMRASPSPQTVA